MDKAFAPLVTSLQALANQIVALAPTETNTLNAIHGWNQVELTLTDLAGYATRFESDLREFASDSVDEHDAKSIVTAAAQLDHFRGQTMQYFWGGNGPHAVWAYMATIDGMRIRFQHLMPKMAVVDPKSLPTQLARRILRISGELDTVVADKEVLAQRMQAINEAYEAAESLPENLASLKDAQQRVAQLTTQADESERDARRQKEMAEYTVRHIQELGDKAEKLIAQCEEAYRITTSKGLAGAFEQRAKGLARSMQLWVAALVLSLGAAAYFGSVRVDLLSRLLAESDPRWGVITLSLVLSLLSVGAPLWFSWVATKQIGQRFRLAEDYGYKASISKAYEGYRREAAELDPTFISRLFGSSLTRLEEPPLRLMEQTSHGSPFHEILNSRAVSAAMEAAPSFREKVVALKEEAEAILRTKSGPPAAKADAR